MYRIWSPSARNEWHPGSNQHRKSASAESYECKKGLAEDPTSSLLQPGHNQFHSIHIHQIFIRYSSGIHQTNQVLRISALENNGNNGSHCNRNRVTSCHIRGADPQADFPIVSGNARLRLWLRQPDVGSVGSGWKFNGINMEQIFHRSHEKSGEYQHN